MAASEPSTPRGTVQHEADTGRVTFVRDIDAPRDIVWQLISTPAGLEQWLAPAKVELSANGSVTLDFGDGGIAGGNIVELVDGRVLEYHWSFPGERDSVVRFELSDLDGQRTHVVLNHRLLPRDQSTNYGAGWHAHLDQLEAVLAGDGPGSFMERFEALLPAYR